MTQIEVRSELRGEMRTKLNQAINKGLDMINKNSEIKLQHVNVNGVIVCKENINVAPIVEFLLTNANIKKFATFHTQHENFNMPKNEESV